MNTTLYSLLRVGNFIGFYNMDTSIFATLLKMNIPMEIGFIDLSSKELTDKRLSLGKREQSAGKHTINGGSYEKLFADIKSVHTDENYAMIVLVDVKNYKLYQPLFSMLGQIKESIYKSCVSINYDPKSDIYSIEFLKSEKGVMNKFVYYGQNSTYMIIDENAPRLITDDASINSILELVGNTL